MTLFCRFNQSKLKHLSNQLKRHLFQITYASLHSNQTKQYVSEHQKRVIPRIPVNFGDKVRFFAAPVQAKAKKEEKDTSGPRLNDKITAEFVRLVNEDGHTIVSLHEAIQRARELNLDLVEVQRTANPPVCKIMDFHREKYKQQLKDKDRVKSKAEVSLRKGDHKEVRFSGKTEDKDLRMKADMVKRLMERGYRVKCTARGSEDQDLGSLLSRLAALIEDVSVVESGPRVERGQAYVIVRHVKFGPPKKGSGKSWKVSANARPEASGLAVSSSPGEEEKGHEESDFEAGVGKSRENLRDKETSWSMLDHNNNFNEVFDFKDEANGAPSRTSSKVMNIVSDRASSQSEVNVSGNSSIKTENRYKRAEPVNRFPTNETGNRGRVRDALRSESQNRDQRRTPTNTNFSPFMRETKREENNIPRNETSKHGPSHHTDPNSSKPGYGVFSSLNINAPGKQDAAAASYRGDRRPPHAPSTNRDAHGASVNKNFPNTKPGKDSNDGRRGWGIFSKEDSNDLPNRMSKPN